MKKKLLFIIVPILIIAGTAAGGFYYVNKNIYVPSPNNSIFETKEEQQQADYAEEKGITNVLLIGVDGRENDKDARTDSIILASVDANNKTIKLVSFMRDMYVPIPGHGQTRINTAYFFGGPELLIKTINQDFDMNIQYFMSIDFRAFQDLVDKLGGIDVEVKDKEVDQINYYIKEANWKNPIFIDGSGYQHLNGQQALAYSRIRKVGNGDYERTERQRKVLSLLVDKARKTSILRLPQLFSAIVPYIKTNIPTTKLMNLGYTAYKFGNTPIASLRIPADGMFDDMAINGASVLVPNIERNIALLDKFMSSTGGTSASNLPAYMENNFHAEDKPVDKRGIKRKTVKIVIPKEPAKDTMSGEDILKPSEEGHNDSTGQENGVIINPDNSGKSDENNSSSGASDSDNSDIYKETNVDGSGNDNHQSPDTSENNANDAGTQQSNGN